ncbi:hypothetical protein U8607_10495 [Methylobacterium durans]|uniref:DUF6925 family protein n=1 Tax=Methylobacterium durans TaxID=2202825 RepID=UPI002AFE954E|nr:hypothetical protein [Methylobacterium durans]MEA1832512.1 hypothetical protein [Methylobacterium durans]
MDDSSAIADLLRAGLADAGTAWSLGTFGAAAEFRRSDDEDVAPLDGGRIGLVSPRGGIGLCLSDALVPFAYETALGETWSHAVALCLPEAEEIAEARSAVTALGADSEALRAEDRDALLFDLGFGLRTCVVGLRTRDPDAVDVLRGSCGTPALDPQDPRLAALPRSALTFVFDGPIGRIEVAGDAGAGGPRAHVVASVLRLGRTHPATAPIPAGLVPHAHMLPPHPCKDASGTAIPFDPARHDAFQALLARWGDPALFALKQHGLGQGERPNRMPDRWSRSVEKVAQAQAERLRACCPQAEEVAQDQSGTGQVVSGHQALS